MLTILCSSESVRWWVWITSEPVLLMILCYNESVWWRVCITGKPVPLMIMCSSESISWPVCVTNELVLLMISCSSKSVCWRVCVNSEPVSLMNFYGRLHIRTSSMIKMIALYDCNIWMLEYEHVYSWNCIMISCVITKCKCINLWPLMC